MNCRRFQNRLYEYVEGSLSASARAAAERHLGGCSACRQAVRAEHALAQVMSSQFQQDAKTLTLPSHVRNRILTAAQGQSTRSAAPASNPNWWNRLFWRAASPALLLLVAAFLLTPRSPGKRMYHVETISSINGDSRPAVSVEIVYHQPACTFRREGNRVIDRLSDETVVATGTLRPGGTESLSPNPDIKL